MILGTFLMFVLNVIIVALTFNYGICVNSEKLTSSHTTLWTKKMDHPSVTSSLPSIQISQEPITMKQSLNQYLKSSEKRESVKFITKKRLPTYKNWNKKKYTTIPTELPTSTSSYDNKDTFNNSIEQSTIFFKTNKNFKKYKERIQKKNSIQHCNFSKELLDVINLIEKDSNCSVLQSIDHCLENSEGKWLPKFGIVCNESTQINDLQSISNSPEKSLITVLEISDQENLHRLRTNDFTDLKNLISLTIRNSSIRDIEPSTFGSLGHLMSLDLSDNMLQELNWNAFLPNSISRDPMEINIIWDGNPLDENTCSNQWLLERRDQDIPDIWKGSGNDVQVSLDYDSNIDSQRLQFDDKLSWGKRSSRTSNFDLPLVNETSTGLMQDNVVNITHLERSTNDPYTDWTKYDCLLSRGANEQRCYLCSPRLSIVTNSEQLTEIKCEASGIPIPHILWHFETAMKVSEEKIDENRNSVSRVISLNNSLLTDWFNSRSIVHDIIMPECKTYNDRGFALKSICDVEELTMTKFYLEPNSINIFTRVTSVFFYLDVHWIRWSFSPCAENVLKANLTFSYTFLFDEKSLTRSTAGVLHYLGNTNGKGFVPGWYRMEVVTPCGKVENFTRFYEGAPHQDSTKECPLVHEFEDLSISYVYKSSNAAEDPSKKKDVPTTTFKTFLHSNETELDDVITVLNNITIDSSSQEKENQTLSVISVALIAIFSALIIMVWISALIVMKHWKGNRIVLSQGSRNYESPFKIVFLDKDKSDKKRGAEEFFRHEMHLLNPDRLVDNPEYMSSSETEDIEITKKQVQVIATEKLKFLSELGEGAFGRVYLGLMETKDGKAVKVAIKTLKSLGPDAQQDVKREVNMLRDLHHDKIVKFFGVCYDSESMLMVFEYMEHGDLNHYLRLHNEDCVTSSSENCNKDPLTVMDCLQIALQIASGMAYLASQHYVHRDLATRNCLVAGNLIVKIGDFGMSRDVYTCDYYQIGGRALLPVRWMPPESILYRRFTIESDIWSFGVVLWEIFTGGKQPWYGYTNQEVITQITAGKMLNCPEKCPPDMYRLITACWAKQPQDRMSMNGLFLRIKSLTTIQPQLVD